MEKYFTIEDACIYDEDYQLKMLRHNEIEGLLEVKAIGVNEKTRYSYNITGKTALTDYFSKTKITKEEFQSIIRGVKKVCEEIKQYLLKEEQLIYHPDYIFWEKGKYYFCYYPKEFPEESKEFRCLCKFIVDHLDYEEEEVMEKAYTLFEKSEEKNFDITSALNEALVNPPLEEFHEYHVEKIELENMMVKEDEEIDSSKKPFKKKKRGSFFKRKKGFNEFEGLILEMEE